MIVILSAAKDLLFECPAIKALFRRGAALAAPYSPSLKFCHPERARPELCEGSASREPALSLPKGTLCWYARATHLSKLGIPQLSHFARPQQMLRYQQPRRPMQPRPRMRRSPNVIQAVHRRTMVGHSRKWTPQKELIRRARPAIRIAANEIDIGSFQISGQIGAIKHS